MEAYEMSRAVGVFDVFFAPLNGIGMFDVSAFTDCIGQSLAAKRVNIGLDLSGLAFLNSGSYNCLSQSFTRIKSCGGEFVIIVDNEELFDLLKHNLPRDLTLFRNEAELLNYSIRAELSAPRNAAAMPVLNRMEEAEKEQDIASKTEMINALELGEEQEETSGANIWIGLIVGVLGIGGLLLYFLL